MSRMLSGRSPFGPLRPPLGVLRAHGQLSLCGDYWAGGEGGVHWSAGDRGCQACSGELYAELESRSPMGSLDCRYARYARGGMVCAGSGVPAMYLQCLPLSVGYLNCSPVMGWGRGEWSHERCWPGHQPVSSIVLCWGVHDREGYGKPWACERVNVCSCEAAPSVRQWQWTV